jgi:hypothetical protein
MFQVPAKSSTVNVLSCADAPVMTATHNASAYETVMSIGLPPVKHSAEMRAIEMDRQRQRRDHDNGDDEKKFGASKHGGQLTKGLLNGP